MPNGAFKVAHKVGNRRLHVQDPGDRGLDGTIGPLQSAIRHHITMFLGPAWSYFDALGSTRELIFWSHLHQWVALAREGGGGGGTQPTGPPQRSPGASQPKRPGEPFGRAK